MMQVQSFTFNPFQENTYVLSDETGECVIIDPGCFDAEERFELQDYITRNRLNPVLLLNTHCHIDHVLGNRFVFETYGLKAQIHPLEEKILAAVPNYGSMFGFTVDTPPEAESTLKDGEVIRFGNTVLQQLHCPGHSPGSICFYYEEKKILIGGDVLFRLSIGRTDLPGGHYQTLIDSIQNKLFLLPGDTYVYSGHGPGTTLSFEQKHNPFLHVEQ